MLLIIIKYLSQVFYEKSLSEHRVPETRAMLAEVEKIIKEEERKSYIDPVKAEEEKETGNDLFKKGLLINHRVQI